MEKWLENYRKWSENENIIDYLKKELESIKDQKDIQDRFYKNLEFGTGGLRGEIGVGTNRVNIYTVRKVTQGLASYIAASGEEAKSKGVVIAYDSRHRSQEFAFEAGLILAHNGIKVYIFDELRPTPELSFAVRELDATAGIVITASHNPAEYNGYKVYWEDGGQITDDLAKAISLEIDSIENELELNTVSINDAIQQGAIEVIGEEIDRKYLDQLKTLSLNREVITDAGSSLKIVYTPLHGTGNKLVRKGLFEFGFKNVYVVQEQELPDPNFYTVESPNPEEHSAFELAIRLGEEVEADILMGTDPDADRVGVAVKNKVGEFVILTGNQLGALLLEYIMSQRAQKGMLPKDGIVVKTIVTSEIGRAIAKNYGIQTIDVLTGFKYIGEKIKEFKSTGEKTFLFGYEESYGYLIGDFVRDKDAVQTCLLTAEMAAYYKSRGLSLYDGLLELFEKYGYYREELVSITLKGLDGQKRIQSIVDSFRQNPPTRIKGSSVSDVLDYLKGINSLPKSNCIRCFTEDKSWFCIRPSGTEPKVKIYIGTCGNDETEAESKLLDVKEIVLGYLN